MKHQELTDRSLPILGITKVVPRRPRNSCNSFLDFLFSRQAVSAIIVHRFLLTFTVLFCKTLHGKMFDNVQQNFAKLLFLGKDTALHITVY